MAQVWKRGGMLKNYLRIAFRNLLKQKGFSFINITGLALGLACSLMIMLWVRDERGIDAFHKNGKDLYFVYERNYMGGKVDSWYWTQGPLAKELKKDFPEIKAGTPLSWPRTRNFAAGEKVLKEDGFCADVDFFSMFSYPILEGSARDALNSPTSIAISKKMATDLFGSPAAAIGKTIRYENKKDFSVKAVFDDMAARVSTSFDYIIPWSAYVEEEQWANDWGSVDPRTVIQLRADANPQQVKEKMKNLLNKMQTERNDVMKIELDLQKYDEYYLHNEFQNGYLAGGRIQFVRLFSLVALFILVIACINFMSLTTAQSVKRAREIGVRKVMGAERKLLIRQFIGEAILITFVAMVFALVLTAIGLPAFNQLTGKQIIIPFSQISFWLVLLGLCLLTGIFSGSYPAIFLSSFNPVQVLKGTVKSTGGAVLFRKGLVVFQFFLSIVLIISTILISRQVNFIRQADIGYNRENLLYIPIEGELGKKLDVFNTTAAKIPGVMSISALTEAPTQMENGSLSVGWTGKDPKQIVRFIHDGISPGFFQTMKMKLVEGTPFPNDGSFDSLGCILNETAVKLMGYKDPIGKPVFMGNMKMNIRGVVKDFHFHSLHDRIIPLLLHMGKSEWFSTILVRVDGTKTRTAIADLKKLCGELNPAFPFSYKFSDEEYEKLYKSDEVTGNLSVIFAVLAIIISCLGLFGLSIFTASQRVKEMGVRKVLGASVPSLFLLLSNEFLLLVGIAFAISVPAGWWAMDRWLSGYAYRISIPWWIFAIAGVIAMAIALTTVCYQALKSARTNPVKSLRSE